MVTLPKPIGDGIFPGFRIGEICIKETLRNNFIIIRFVDKFEHCNSQSHNQDYNNDDELAQLEEEVLLGLYFAVELEEIMLRNRHSTVVDIIA